MRTVPRSNSAYRKVLLWVSLLIGALVLAGTLSFQEAATAYADEATPSAPSAASASIAFQWKESAAKSHTGLFSNNATLVATVNGSATRCPIVYSNKTVSAAYNGTTYPGSFVDDKSKSSITFNNLPGSDVSGNTIVWIVEVKAPAGYSATNSKGTLVFTENILGKYALNKKSLTLQNVRKSTLKIKNCPEKVTWSSSNRKVATVNSKGVVKAVKKGTCTITAKTAYSKKTFKLKVTVKNPKTVWAIKIPRYNQGSYGYPLGCEGVSFYMALKGQGYLKGVSLHQFMATQPKATKKSKYNPNTGYAGSPRQGKGYGVNRGKRTSIYPKAVTKWGKQYGFNVVNLQGASVKKLQSEIKNGNPVLVWVTSDWQSPRYKKYPFSKKRQVENNHCTVVTGYNSKTGSYQITDCSQTRSKSNCKYWINKKTFERLYNLRHYAVAVRRA